MDYKIQGLDASGHFVSIELSAAGPQQARQIGRERGLDVLAVESSRPGLAILRRSRAAKFPLLLFNQELLALLEAGLSIVEALETLLEKEARAENRHVLKGVVASLHEGQSLSAAFESQPAAFPELYIATVRSSERSGNLADSLQRYVAYQIQVDQMRKKIIAASIYPLLLMVVGGLVVLFLLIYVIPKFSHIYADTGHDLPFASWLLLRWGELIETHGGLLAGLFFGGLGVAA